MTDRTAPSSDARKRRHERDMADAHATARARDAYRTRTHAIDPETGEFTPLTQESDMTDHRADAERALSSIDASDDPRNLPAGLDGIGHALLAIHDTLAGIRDRLPERTEVKVAPFDPDLIARNLDALKHAVSKPMRGHGECCEPAPADDLPGEPVEVEPEKTHPCPGCGTFTGKRVCNSCWGTSDDPEAGYSQAECIEAEPAPADDLPGEPVEPGDLRAGDRVAFTYDGERIEGPLVRRFGLLSVEMTDHSPIDVRSILGRWATGISDVRLLERAPREDEDPDEALARVIFGDAYGSHEGLRQAQLDVARAAREHIEAEEAENHPVGCGQMIRDVRDGDGFVTTIDGVMIAKTDSWNDLTERAKKAEAEAKHLRERLDALREDLSPGGLVWPVDAALRRDDERAKGEQR